MSAAPTLVKFLKDGNPTIRIAAAHALVQLGVRKPELIETIKTLLHDDRPEVRAAAVRKILTSREVIIGLPQVKQDLVALLGDASGDVRIEAAESLLQLEDGTDRIVRIYPSAQSSTNAKSQPEDVTDRIVIALESQLRSSDLTDEQEEKSHRALIALARIGPKAQRSIPRIREYLDCHTEDYKRVYALIALVAIQGQSEETDSELPRLLIDSPYPVTIPGLASVLLTTKGPVQESGIQVIIIHTIHNATVGTGASVMFPRLEVLGDKAAPLVPHFIRFLHEGDSFHRQIAARALGCIGHPAHEALDALRELANTQNTYLRLQVRYAIRRIGG